MMPTAAVALSLLYRTRAPRWSWFLGSVDGWPEVFETHHPAAVWSAVMVADVPTTPGGPPSR